MPDSLSAARSNLAGTTLQGFGIFCGGQDKNGEPVDVADVYDPALVRSSIPKGNHAFGPAGAAVNGYALFGGGSAGKFNSSISSVAAFRYV